MHALKKLFRKYSRVLMIFAVVAAVVYFLIRDFQAFGNTILALLGIGAVIIIHEFGHFISAKLSGIKVEAFSIGFSPILLGVKRTEQGFRVRVFPGAIVTEDESEGNLFSFTIGSKAKAGETEYRLGMIPFGGFVKMLGQDDTGSEEATNDPRSYANKPVWKRMIVIASGVVFNVVSAVIAFMVVFLIGINLSPPVVGSVIPGSPADRAGLRGGDEIIEIAGKSSNLDFTNIAMAAALSDRDEEIPLKVKHKNGIVEDIVMAAEQVPGMPMKGFGITQAMTLKIANVSDSNELYKRIGLRSGDKVVAVDGRKTASYWELEDIVADYDQPTITVTAERETAGGEMELIQAELELTLIHTERRVVAESDINHVYTMVPRLKVAAVMGKESELEVGDVIVKAAGTPNPTYKELRDITTEYEKKELALEVLRADSEGAESVKSLKVFPKKDAATGRVMIGFVPSLDANHAVVAKTIDVNDGPAGLAVPRGALLTAVDGTGVENFYEVIRALKQSGGKMVRIDYLADGKQGSVSFEMEQGADYITAKPTFAELIPFDGLERLYKADGPGEAIKMGYQRTTMFIAQSYLTLRRFVGGLVSPKNFMGPVGIIAFSYRIVSEQPFIYYVYFLSLISAFIAVFNSLPFLPFDGGHIVFLAIEKAKGSEVSPKIQGMVTYVGLALVGALAVYVTFNDVVRTFF